jgi:hypothetical protein
VRQRRECARFWRPKAENLVNPAKTEDDVAAIAKRWKNKRGSLIMALHALQDRYGYVPREAAMSLGEQMDVPLARIYEVLTFYNYFRLKSPGKQVVSVCMGTACYLKGAPAPRQSVRGTGHQTRRDHRRRRVPPAGRSVRGLLWPGAGGHDQRQASGQGDRRVARGTPAVTRHHRRREGVTWHD